jgi:hypothetical protein
MKTPWELGVLIKVASDMKKQSILSPWNPVKVNKDWIPVAVIEYISVAEG